MYLTTEEERALKGEYGWADQLCMQILVRLGDLFNADKLIPIESAHVSGVSYKTLGDAPIEFLKTFADAEARVKVRTTLNPQSLDTEYLRKIMPARLCEKQLDILEQFKKMGLIESLTCTPYHLQKPHAGSHLAWAESSAVVYANSVLGAWTNREGGPSALAAAIIGKTPDYGIHKTENRQPNISVNVKARLRNRTEYGAIGICLGRVLRGNIPVLIGLHTPSKEKLKQFSAAVATTGMTNMFHIKKPETTATEKISIDDRDVTQAIEELSTATKEPELVFIGCPHCSYNEVKQIADLIGSKKVKPQKHFWVCTSGHVRDKCANSVKKIEHSGGHVLAGVCTVVSWTEKLGIKTIMTDSAKTAYYAPTLNRAEANLAPLKECLKTAFKG